MQTKIFTAAIAALTFSSAQAAVVNKRVTVNPGSVTFPSFTVDPNEFGLVPTIYGLIDKLQSDIAQSVGLVNQQGDSALKTFAEKYAYLLALAAQLKANAEQTVINVNQTITALKPATPSQSPATATKSAGPSPTETVGKTAADVVTKVEGVVAQIQKLAAGAQTQVNNAAKSLKATYDPILNAVINGVTTTLTKLVADLTSTISFALKTIAGTAATALATVEDTLTTTQGTANAAVDRVTNAKVALNPFVNAGVKPEVSI